MSKLFGTTDWKAHIPIPVYDEKPQYTALYEKAWELAFAHIKDVPDMPQTPYMDEAFCETQLWIWDTCFMSLYCKYARDVFPGVESLRNFYEVLHNGGHLARIVPSEKEPEWTGRVLGEPYEVKIHIADNPPLFAWVEYENALLSGDVSHVKRLLYESQVLQKHFEWLETLREPLTPRGVFAPTCWIAEADGYRWEGGRSGMDNTPRGRIGEHAEEQRPNNPDLLWLDAVCQQALSARMIARLFELLKDEDNQNVWEERYRAKKDLVQAHYWDDEDGFYYDIEANTHRFCRVKTMASYWPLTAEIADERQAAVMASYLQDPNTFGGVVPFPSLSRDDNDFHDDGEYWRGGVWLPTAYAALKGLKEYGLLCEAREASCRLLDHMYQTYVTFEPHTIWESYAPTAPKPATVETGSGTFVRPDFCGWSALGPIAAYIEFVLGFHTINAFTKTVEWAKPSDVRGKVGIRNLRFGDVVTDIEAVGDTCVVSSNETYTLRINGTDYYVKAGIQELRLEETV